MNEELSVIIITVETFITVTNSTFQCYIHLDYHAQSTNVRTPGAQTIYNNDKNEE